MILYFLPYERPNENSQRQQQQHSSALCTSGQEGWRQQGRLVALCRVQHGGNISTVWIVKKEKQTHGFTRSVSSIRLTFSKTGVGIAVLQTK